MRSANSLRTELLPTMHKGATTGVKRERVVISYILGYQMQLGLQYFSNIMKRKRLESVNESLPNTQCPRLHINTAGSTAILKFVYFSESSTHPPLGQMLWLSEVARSTAKPTQWRHVIPTPQERHPLSSPRDASKPYTWPRPSDRTHIVSIFL